jgi:hypothetical protein
MLDLSDLVTGDSKMPQSGTPREQHLTARVARRQSCTIRRRRRHSLVSSNNKVDNRRLMVLISDKTLANRPRVGSVAEGYSY